MRIANSKREKKYIRPKSKTGIPTSGNRNVNPTDPIPENSVFSPVDGHDQKQDQAPMPAPYTMMPSMTSKRKIRMIQFSRMKRMALFPGDMAGYNAANPENPGNLQQGQTGPGAALGEPPTGIGKQRGWDWLTNLSNSFKRYVSRVNNKRTRRPSIKDQTHLDSAGD